MSNVAEDIDQQHKSEIVRQTLLRFWRTHSDREIAKAAGVSNRTVSQLRKKLEGDGTILPRSPSTQSFKASQYEVCTCCGT